MNVQERAKWLEFNVGMWPTRQYIQEFCEWIASLERQPYHKLPIDGIYHPFPWSADGAIILDRGGLVVVSFMETLGKYEGECRLAERVVEIAQKIAYDFPPSV